MKLSVEISMYPLQDGYIHLIDDFLNVINENAADVEDVENIEIRTSNMSTRLYGDYQAVTTLLNQSMQRSMQLHGKIVFVCKYLEGDARELEGYA